MGALQSLHHLVGVLSVSRALTLPLLSRDGPQEDWPIDDAFDELLGREVAGLYPPGATCKSSSIWALSSLMANMSMVAALAEDKPQ